MVMKLVVEVVDLDQLVQMEYLLDKEDQEVQEQVLHLILE